MKKKLFLVVLLLIIGVAGYGAVLSRENVTAELPPLKDGDILLQTSWTSQTMATLFATHSLYTHVGMLEQGADGWQVIEASQVVDKVPLTEWINRGQLRRLTVVRDPRISDADRVEILKRAGQFIGRPYDFYFLTGERELYCSELPYLSYLYVGKRVGKAVPLSQLHVNNMFVKKIIEQRWQTHPICTHNKLEFEECYKYIMDQYIVTPASIAEDANLKVIYDNYPF